MNFPIFYIFFLCLFAKIMSLLTAIYYFEAFNSINTSYRSLWLLKESFYVYVAYYFDPEWRLFTAKEAFLLLPLSYNRVLCSL